MTYAQRTCHKCGFRNSQPNMRQEEIEYVSGSSQAALSSRAIIGSTIFGSDSSAKQINNWISGKGKRQYKRKRLVWVCANGCKNAPSNTVGGSVKRKRTSGGSVQPQRKVSHAVEMLELEVSHAHHMFDDLVLWADKLDKTLSRFSPGIKIDDAEAKILTKEIEAVTVELKSISVQLGKIYEEDFIKKDVKSKFFRFVMTAANLTMWALGCLAIVALLL